MSIDISSLIDIREAIDLALKFAEGFDFDQFLRDERTSWAVYSQIIVIGEAANRLTADFRRQFPVVSWKKVISMRHHLIHGYDEINWQTVWETLTGDLPKLKAAITPLIPPEPKV